LIRSRRGASHRTPGKGHRTSPTRRRRAQRRFSVVDIKGEWGRNRPSRALFFFRNAQVSCQKFFHRSTGMDPTEYLFANAMTASPRGTSGSMQISDSNDRPRRRPSDAGQTYAQRSSSTASTSSSLHFNYVCRSHACHSAYRCLRHRVVPNLLPRVHGTSFRPLRERRNRRANESSACSFVTKARLYHPVKKIRVTDCCLGSVAPPQDSSECFVPA